LQEQGTVSIPGLHLSCLPLWHLALSPTAAQGIKLTAGPGKLQRSREREGLRNASMSLHPPWEMQMCEVPRRHMALLKRQLLFTPAKCCHMAMGPGLVRLACFPRGDADPKCGIKIFNYWQPIVKICEHWEHINTSTDVSCVWFGIWLDGLKSVEAQSWIPESGQSSEVFRYQEESVPRLWVYCEKDWEK
jgi:hypothetical protein